MPDHTSVPSLRALKLKIPYRGEILSDNMRGLMLPYGEGWRKWRRVLHSGFHARRADTYNEIQHLESCVLMHEEKVNLEGLLRCDEEG